jgi:DNA-binding MarR family transcriptional regulator
LEIVLPDSAAILSRHDDPLSALPGYALRRAANAMMADLATRLAAIDLRISEAAVLQVIAERADMTSSDIGKALDIQRANMVPLLNRLEAATLIRRQPIDRKSQAVVLTEYGQARLSDVRRITLQFEDDLMARIPARHREHFLPALQALTDGR